MVGNRYDIVCIQRSRLLKVMEGQSKVAAEATSPTAADFLFVQAFNKTTLGV